MTKTNSASVAIAKRLSDIDAIFIDAGIRSFRIVTDSDKRRAPHRWILSSSRNLKLALAEIGLDSVDPSIPVYLTGKLYESAYRRIGHGVKILSPAALWAAADDLTDTDPVAILEVSASGFTAVGVDRNGALKNGLLAANARCGAGSGINIDRVLQKLAISHETVDELLHTYVGTEGEKKRHKINVRTDRCGVFASSATISDKNQGIPIDFALAVTLKSEIVKACAKIPGGFKTVFLTGGVFAWQFTRDCARDILLEMGVEQIEYDRAGDLPIRGMRFLQKRIGDTHFAKTDSRVHVQKKLPTFPSFQETEKRLSRDHRYVRIADPPLPDERKSRLQSDPVFIGLDVGSTMAKTVISAGSGRKVLLKNAISNAGDTIETIKAIFRDIRATGIEKLQVKKIGITGSARYQVQKTLENVYPQMKGAVTVLVENYAHARGSMDEVHRHIARLKNAGIGPINENRCILVDVGGEDTKISTLDIKRSELFDNAMNIKCSAGTGSLLDVLTALFDIPNIPTASNMAMAASDALAINATCAVFLMENAVRLQSEGVSKGRILASAIRAIVENMAHSLWNQLALPGNAVALLHGQTMRGVPLSLATAERLQTHIGAPVYCLVPPEPGHRACIGLINSMDNGETMAKTLRLDGLINYQFEKRIVQCRGVACGDPEACCNRSLLRGVDEKKRPFSVLLGGCTAVNELRSGNQKKKKVLDTYAHIWKLADSRMPRSHSRDRLVIPRSFCVSEWALFFSKLFEPIGIAVHVDNVTDADIKRAQSHIHIDTCAPHIGAIGQMIRLVEQPHGLILSPQIEFLPTRGGSLGRSCTINQGGMATAKGVAETVNPDSHIFLFHLSFKGISPDEIAQQLYPRLLPVYTQYGKNPTIDQFRRFVNEAWNEQSRFKQEICDVAADMAEKAVANGQRLALVAGREYVLNPGIFDSHVGRLLRDKGFAGIPGHLLDIDLNPAFDHLYWRNAHAIATLVDAVASKTLHRAVHHPTFKNLLKKIETDPESEIALIQVSTFLCGPDSVTNPLIDELAKNRPFLRIQSDAVIQELAHLENRMNTYVKQLQKKLYNNIEGSPKQNFEVKVLEDLTNREPLNPETDALYLPTLSDNRSVTAPIRGAGFTCIDNYDENYDLQAAVKKGRAVVGDGVCTPLAAVYGDILYAIEDFVRRKQRKDVSVAGKSRLLIFNNKGAGPCRQGQYVETHKLYVHKETALQSCGSQWKSTDPFFLKFLVGRENKGFNIGFPEWAYLRCMQGIILQGVLHQLLLAGASQCADITTYKAFLIDYVALKKELYRVQEYDLRPSDRALAWVKRNGRNPVWGWVAKYVGYRMYDRSLSRPIRKFAKKWNQEPLHGTPVRIHLEGEVYMRVAQLEEILKVLIAQLGFRRFLLTHSPVWSFLEYKLAGSMMRAKEEIREGKNQISRAHSEVFRNSRQHFVRAKRKQWFKLKAAYMAQRYLLALPLYRAAGIDLPEALPDVLRTAKAIIPTRRPGGELVPYIGEVATKLKKGYDLILNVAPEGCMVSSMGEVLTPAAEKMAQGNRGIVQPIFSQQGDVDEEKLSLALLKSIGPYKLYRRETS